MVKFFVNPACKPLFAVNCLVFALVSNLAFTQAWADEADLLLDILQQQRSMQAQFEQRVTDQDERVVQSSAGVLKIQKPRQFLWRTSEPFEQEIVSDGEKMWVLDVDLDQLTIQPVEQQWDSTPALLLTGDEREVRQNFAIALLSQQGQRMTFAVQPLADESAYKQLQIEVDGAKVVAMHFSDHLGQTSLIRFSQIVVDEPIAKQEFIIVPAPGVDVIDYFAGGEAGAAAPDSTTLTDTTSP